MFNDHMFG